VFFGEGSGAADVVGMFVGKKQGGDLLRLAADMFQAFFENTRSDTNIDQDAGLFAFDIDGVALTAAGEYGKLKNSPPPSIEYSFISPPFDKLRVTLMFDLRFL